MAVQVWIGEKPEHSNERRAIVALANGLERLDGLYLLLANFSVGGRAVDLVIIKHDAIFIVELKHCDGKVFGDVNGPWFVESSNGNRKRLNPGRKNPYNQVISYYYSLINYLNEHRIEFLSPNRAASVDFRTCRRLVVIAPTIQEGSQVEIDWKVECKGFDELPAYLVTERSSEIELTDDEMLRIPEILHLTHWSEVNALFNGVMRWDEEPQPVVPVAPPAPPPTPASAPTVIERTKRALSTWTGRAAAAFAVISILLALLLVSRPMPEPRIDQPGSLVVSTSQPGPPAGGVFPGPLFETQNCVWSEFQPTGRRRGGEPGVWENVGVLGTAPNLAPEVVVTLEEVSFCDDQIKMTWSVQNNMGDQSVVLPLTAKNLIIRDEHNTIYPISEKLSQPLELKVGPRDRGRGVAMIDQPVSLNASTLRITLKELPFGTADWMVRVGR